MINEFFNKSRFIVSKVSDQYEVKPGISFTLYTIIYDSITYVKPTTITASLVKVSGRDQVVLPTVVTVTGQSFSAAPALVDWDGSTSLMLRVVIDSTQIVLVPLVQKG